MPTLTVDKAELYRRLGKEYSELSEGTSFVFG
jgi:hypothetical protein